jgi:hypothetical protein
MQSKMFRLVALVFCLAFVGSMTAQEGHPLKGSWRGDWGPSATDRNPVVIVMDWDGSMITGTVNPGPNALPFKRATLNAADWTLQIEVDAKDQRGQTITYTINGKVENIRIPSRTFVGTWTHGNVKGDFKVTRQ